MTDPTIDRNDYQKDLRLQQLRTELDAMGYHVVRKDWVRKFAVAKVVTDQDRYSPHWPNIKNYMLRAMGHELGHGLLGSGAVKASEESSSFNGAFCLRSEVSIILRDPQFDMPMWANPEYRK